MNKKNLTINKLAIGNLKQRRKQYTILIIGIILAMVFSSSTLFFMFSSNETYREKQFNMIGKQHGAMCVYEDDGSLYPKLLEEGLITDYGLAHIIGYGYLNGGDRNLGTAIAWLDDKCKEISYQSFIEGSYPQNENEIAIEETALLKLGLNAKIGDEITLDVDIQDGLDYYGTNEKTYKLVGIVTDKRKALDYSGGFSNLLPAAFVAQGTQTEVGGRELITAYVSMRDNSSDAYWALLDYLYDTYDGYFHHDGWNAYRSSNFFNGITSSGNYIAVIAIVLIFVSCVAIVNAFNTNLKERKKQIGMLRAVGATRRQIIKIFGREAFIISLICTPVSIVISYGIVRIAISLMNEKAMMTKSLSVLAVSAVVCIIVTMLAAMIPLFNASRISPMQAIRNIEINRKMNMKKIKSKMQFDVPSHLAKRNAQFYKGGKVAVSSILIATIIFSCLGFSYINCVKDDLSYSGWDYELSSMSSSYYPGMYVNYKSSLAGMSEVDEREIEAYPYFSEVISEKQINSFFEVGKISDYFLCFYDVQEQLEVIENNTENIQEYISGFSNGKNILTAPIYSYDENTIKTLEDSLTAGKINYERLATGEEIILVAPQSAKYVKYDTEDGVKTKAYYDVKTVPEGEQIIYEGELPYSVGDKINISVLEYTNNNADEEETPDDYIRTDREVTVGAIVSPKKLGNRFSAHGNFSFLTIHSGMNAFCENAKYQALYMTVNPDMELDDETDETISEYINFFRDKYDGWFNSGYAAVQQSKEDLKFMLVAMLSIVLIAFVVCAAIINNSLTASIREKKKEIGTLRAVGADIGVLVKSYIRQLLSMLGVGYGAGFSVFCIIYALIVIICNIRNERYDFVFSPWETLAFSAVLFAICSFNLWSKVRKEMKNSIVDNIREL